MILDGVMARMSEHRISMEAVSADRSAETGSASEAFIRSLA
jgi:hypothetical protein